MAALWLLYDLLANNQHFVAHVFRRNANNEDTMPERHVLPALLQCFSFVFRTVEAHGEIYPWLCVLILRVLSEHGAVCEWATEAGNAVEVPLAPVSLYSTYISFQSVFSNFLVYVAQTAAAGCAGEALAACGLDGRAGDDDELPGQKPPRRPVLPPDPPNPAAPDRLPPEKP